MTQTPPPPPETLSHRDMVLTLSSALSSLEWARNLPAARAEAMQAMRAVLAALRAAPHPPTQPADLNGRPIGGVAWLACRGCGGSPGHKDDCPGVVAESMLFEALSDSLTGGNAATWDEIIHAAEQFNGLGEKVKR